MPTVRTAPQCLAIAALLAAAQPLAPAVADDGRNRSGFYVGGHVGYLFGNPNATLGDPTGSRLGRRHLALWRAARRRAGGLRDIYFPSRLMLGIELDGSFPDYLDDPQVLSYRATGTGTASEELEWLATLRGRIGYDMGGWTPFVTGGIAWASTRFSRVDLTTGNEDTNSSNIRLGYMLGGGVDYRLDSRWSARVEYLYTSFGLGGFAFASAPARYNSLYDLHQVRVGLNYKFGAVDKSTENTKDRGPGTFEVHGQAAFVYQGYPPFSAAYDGPQSLPFGGQSRETAALSASSACACGRAASSTTTPRYCRVPVSPRRTAPAAFPTARRSATSPTRATRRRACSCARTIGQGGEREKVESDYLQLAGERDVSRRHHPGRPAMPSRICSTTTPTRPTRASTSSIGRSGRRAPSTIRRQRRLHLGPGVEVNRPSWAVRLGYFLGPPEPTPTAST